MFEEWRGRIEAEADAVGLAIVWFGGVDAAPSRCWSVDELADVAGRLGRVQAALATAGRVVWDGPWLARPSRTPDCGLSQLAAVCPRTLCLHDLGPSTLRRRSDGTVEVTSRSACGDGALGEDAGSLVLAAGGSDELAAAVEAAYLSGVDAGGWDGDPRWVRIGMRTAARRSRHTGTELAGRWATEAVALSDATVMGSIR